MANNNKITLSWLATHDWHVCFYATFGHFV